VTALVPGAGTYNFVMGTTSNTATSFSSKEGANPPQLVVVTGAGGATATFTPTATPPSCTVPSGVSAFNPEVSAADPVCELFTGLRGEYYDEMNLSGYMVVRYDAAPLSFNWGTGSPVAGIDADTFSARWTGTVQPTSSGTYTFYAVVDDGVRLWIDNQLVIDAWTDGAKTASGSINISSGINHALKLEYYENTGSAAVRLEWQGPGSPTRSLVSSLLTPPGVPGSNGTGIMGITTLP
jgi:PA14 domain